jgi:predicted O-methyltransferase YrrM
MRWSFVPVLAVPALADRVPAVGLRAVPVLAAAHLAISLAIFSLPASAQNPEYANKLAPYVASPVHVVDRMLEMANIRPGETLYDLGSGDGRILIAAVQKYKVKAVGVEISPRLVAKAETSIAKAGLEGQARVIQGDLLNVDFTGADVVTIYLATPLNEQLRPRLEKYLKPGARVVSHDYAIPGWKPSKVDKTEGSRSHLIYLYEMPPVKN